ncbi:hypothetical protein [Halorubrum sp. AJ67]|uniref:hypothetical protein n=1 Tax=Halorubrum sp. AJ67 TaxID=1173487 RepID=UPI0003DBBF4A|nr:hypothetical protein [Halorubrum sp. AJ67]CDK38233.1 uncharacterized protein BN903_433 [Halorubrum sp. AJ67]
MDPASFDTAGRDWELRKRGIPASAIAHVPNAATVWACLEHAVNEPTTLTIYTPGDGDVHVTVHQDDFLVCVACDTFETTGAAAEYVRRLMDHYGSRVDAPA